MNRALCYPHSWTIRAWLYSRGGRDERDLEKDEEGHYVMMGDGDGGRIKVRLPKELKDDTKK